MGREYKCQLCGQEFEPTCHKSGQKFCSAECRIEYHNAKRYYGGKVDVCPECGVPVEQSGERGWWRRFCSEECRKEWWNEYHKANPRQRVRQSGMTLDTNVVCGASGTPVRRIGRNICMRPA